MATVNFYIRKSKAQGSDSGAIFLKYFDQGEQFTFTLGYEADPSQWITKDGRTRDNEALNLELDTIATDILKTRLTILNEEGSVVRKIRITGQQVKDRWLNISECKPSEGGEKTIIDLLQEFVEDPDREKPLAPSTILNYKSTINHLILFTQHGEYKVTSLILESVTSTTFINIKQFLTDDKVRGGLEMRNGTVNKTISCIKSAMRYFATKYDLNIAMLDAIPRMDRTEDIFFVTYDELERLKLIEFKDVEMQNVVNLYIFACYAPARYNDLFNLKDHNLVTTPEGIKLLDFISGKTGVHTLIPLNTYCADLIAQMCSHGKLLDVPEKGISEVLHRALKSSGLFDDEVAKRIYRGTGKPTEIVKKRWEVLNFHTSRDTFGSNMIALGETLFHVSSALGHKNIQTTMKYVHLMKSEYYSSILEHQNVVRDTSVLQILKQA